ncbi:nuclear transport factor 2 family protein [Winogradskyella sp. A3E31]|uniref:nuclear transport factor 2 family protein n=1 Tax=Winogradskyella sp. A3E31 TaxID=3349637 RepID=UPI00398A72F9
MRKRSLSQTVAIAILLLCSTAIQSQTLENLKAINTTWSKFYKAFEALDAQLMADIHSKDLVRVSGGSRILDYNTYIGNYRQSFKSVKEQGSTRNISLRFFERLNDGKAASERGIYKLTVNKGKQDEQSYYGQFHVIFKKVDNTWMILVDYDSNENNTIGEKQFLEAHAIDDFSPFINE